MIRICFVCLGNICRSPMAEAICAHLLAERGVDAQVDSSGTSGWHIGASPDPRTLAVCRQRGVAIDHAGRKAVSADFTAFDYVLAMDDENLAHLQAMAGAGDCRQLSLLGEYDPQGQREVADPYYGRDDGFERMYDHIYRSCAAFLDAVTMTTATPAEEDI